jgi:L-ascorbate metabolism protein UlaG (beta-lactamase superfamily)
MPPEEAAACAVAFHPGLVVPYHYAGSDLATFTSALQGKVPVTLAEFYPGGLPW